MLNQERLQRALEELEVLGVPQMLVYDPMAIYYFTGKRIDPMERLLVLYISKDKEPKLVLNRLFHCPEELGVEKVWVEDTTDTTEVLAALTDHDKPLGIDKDFPAKHLLPLIEAKAGSSFKNTSLAIDRVRSCKDEKEQQAMRESSLLNDTCMAEFKKRIREGVTEEQLAEEIKAIYRAHGATEIPFVIVAFGANAADPHHEPDNTVLKEGDCVLFDVGATANGYHSDMTRTFFFKKADEKAKEVYETVKAANEAAEKAVKPGMRFCDIDKTARELIEKAGYGPCFTHRLGHSIGIQVHEAGDVSAVNTDILKPGMTFSVEPGIYIPGEVGVRIEDLVLVTEHGCEVLNHAPKMLEIIGD